MSVFSSVIDNTKQYAKGAFGLARIETNEVVEQIRKKTITHVTFLLAGLLGLAWATVAFAIWLALYIGWPASSAFMAILVLGSSILYFSFPKEDKDSLAKDAKLGILPQLDRSDYKLMIDDAESNLKEVGEEIREKASVVLHPQAVLENSIARNPLVFFAGGIALGLLAGVKQSRRHPKKEYDHERPPKKQPKPDAGLLTKYETTGQDFYPPGNWVG